MYTSRSRNSWCLSSTVLCKSDISSDSQWTSSTFQLHSSKLPPLFSTVSVVSKLFDIWSSKPSRWCGCFYSLCNKCSCKWLHSSIWAVTVESAQSVKHYSFKFPGSTVSDLSSSWVHCGRGMWITTPRLPFYTQCCSNSDDGATTCLLVLVTLHEFMLGVGSPPNTLKNHSDGLKVATKRLHSIDGYLGYFNDEQLKS